MKNKQLLILVILCLPTLLLGRPFEGLARGAAVESARVATEEGTSAKGIATASVLSDPKSTKASLSVLRDHDHDPNLNSQSAPAVIYSHDASKFKQPSEFKPAQDGGESSKPKGFKSNFISKVKQSSQKIKSTIVNWYGSSKSFAKRFVEFLRKYFDPSKLKKSKPAEKAESSKDVALEPKQTKTSAKVQPEISSKVEAATTTEIPANNKAVTPEVAAKDKAANAEIPAKDKAATAEIPSKDKATTAAIPLKGKAAAAEISSKDMAATPEIPLKDKAKSQTKSPPPAEWFELEDLPDEDYTTASKVSHRELPPTTSSNMDVKPPRKD